MNECWAVFWTDEYDPSKFADIKFFYRLRDAKRSISGLDPAAWTEYVTGCFVQGNHYIEKVTIQ
jgi:hypothetical protein